MAPLDLSGLSGSPGHGPENVTAIDALLLGDVQATLSIDWLTLRFPMLTAEDEEALVPALLGYLADPEAAGAYGISRGGKKLSANTLVAFQVFAPKSWEPLAWGEKPVASARVKKGKAGKPVAFVHIHPPGLAGDGAEHVVTFVLRTLLNRAPWEILGARVLRLDLALDLHGVQADGFAWSVAGKRIRRAFVHEPALLSQGFGAPKHGSAAVYDKGKACERPPDTPPRTRVEVRLRPGCAVQDLPALKNPFAKIRATDVRAAWKALGRHPIEAEGMLGLAQLKGTKAVVHAFPEGTPVPMRPAQGGEGACRGGAALVAAGEGLGACARRARPRAPGRARPRAGARLGGGMRFPRVRVAACQG